MIIIGLGNPGEEYEYTRHNAGRIVTEHIAKNIQADTFKNDKILCAHTTKGELAEKKCVLILPNTFMNESGKSVAPLMTSKKELEKLIVMYDDLDLPRNTFKISFNRSAGGHNGVKSIIQYLKSEAFVRIRIGIAPVSTTGEIKKPKGEEKVLKWVLGVMNESERVQLKKMSKSIQEALEMIVQEGVPKAMSVFNEK